MQEQAVSPKEAILLEDLALLERYVQEINMFFPVPLCFVSPAGVILESNTALQELLGYGRGALIGEPLSKISGIKNFQVISTLIEQSGTISGQEFSFIANGEKQIPVEVFAKARRDDNGVASGFFLGLIDLTNIRQTERELGEVHYLRSEIVSTVTHQLRAPLSRVKWALSGLLKGDFGPLTPEQRDVIQSSFESNDRMVGFINDMLSADRIRAGKLEYVAVDIEIVELIQSVLDEAAPAAKRKDISFKFVHQDENLPAISIDVGKTRAIFQNLIDNAIKYTKYGGTVRVSVNQDARFISVFVQDDGIGIPKEEQKSIFRRFFRASNATKMDPDGSGLGLFIVRSIIEGQGGRISFESQEGVGTTFYFAIPIQKL